MGFIVIDYGELVYLDPQKTGSGFTRALLETACILEERQVQRHRVDSPSGINEDAFFFITIRYPAKIYSSLFRFGLDGNGGLFKRLTGSGYGHLYNQDRFEDWATFVLSDTSQEVLGEKFGAISTFRGLGIVSSRFLNLVCLGRLDSVLQEDDISLSLAKAMSRLHVIQTTKLNNQLLETKMLS